MVDAVVVGSGPNGLAAALTLARAGLEVVVRESAAEIGGGTRSAELIEPGVLHDICSAVHPFGVASPFLRSLDLAPHGLRWLWPEVDLAHPLDDGSAGVLVRSLERTAEGLGSDGPRWRSTFGRLVEDFDDLALDVMAPLFRIPGHPVKLARFGVPALLPATVFANRWRSDPARALFAGIAAHSFQPLTRATTAAVGSLLGAAGMAYGWPVAEGGSQAVTSALASMLVAHGGRIELDCHVSSLRELPQAAVTLLDVEPHSAVQIAGDQVSSLAKRALTHWKFGPAAFKVDLVVDGPIPWMNEDCRRAGTIHLGGKLEEVAAAEAAINRGDMPERPFVLVGQQYLADPSRSSGTHNPVWAYAHVPNNHPGDATEAVLAQIERFAPGFRDQVVATAIRSPAEFQRYNPNYRGGDIGAGANTPRQTVVRPRLSPNPYRIGERLFLCSAATPPGAGVHGMCGYHAARSALSVLNRRSGERPPPG